MFEYITWLVTNRCGLGCKYCNWMAKRPKEATLEQKMQAVAIMSKWKKAQDRFCCLLGGDLLWMNGVQEFIQQCNAYHIPYGFCSSCCDFKLMQTVSPFLKNISISCDPAPFDDFFRWKKSYAGAYWIGKLKQLNPAIDAHATVTVDRANYKYLAQLIEVNTDLGIWTEVTMIHWHKSNFDLVPERSAVDSFTMVDKDELTLLAQKLCKMKNDGYLIHSSHSFLASIPQHAIELDWQCDRPCNLVLDSDLSCRLCLHVPGNRVRKWKIFDLADEHRWQEFLEDWHKDQTELCPKCFWDCQFEGINASNAATWIEHKG